MWTARATGTGFHWKYDLGGYYNLLGRGLAQGQLHLPVQPSPELLALPDPWDPSANEALRLHDVALFNGRYYLYHGVGPAIMLFLPWRIAAGHDLPENFALVLFCFAGFLFSCASLLRLLRIAKVAVGPMPLAAMLLALGICQGAPFLLNRVAVYELAVGGGYFCLSAAFFFLIQGISADNAPRSVGWLAASGLMFGMAVACRPHLGLAGGIACVALLVKQRVRVTRRLGAFVIPLALVGVAIGAYNYARFGNPFEFGIRYLLAGPFQNRVTLSAANIVPGLYLMLFSPPDFSPVFPWARSIFRFPFGGFPPGYVVEGTVGAVHLAPTIALALLLPIARRLRNLHRWAEIRVPLLVIAASSIAILLFLSTTGWSTQRYLVDFLPAALLMALVSFAIHTARTTGLRWTLVSAVLLLSIAYGVLVSLALGLSGPYDDVLRYRPASYLRIARWFSPFPEHRPLLNPKLDVAFIAEFPVEAGHGEPLVTLGFQAYRHFVYTEHPPGKLRIVSQSEGSRVFQEMEDVRGKRVKVSITYSPESGNLTTNIEGKNVLVHHIGTLVTAPSQVTVGENRIDVNAAARRFSGQIRDIQITVAPSP